jgi:uncharacterized membrane protein
MKHKFWRRLEVSATYGFFDAMTQMPYYMHWVVSRNEIYKLNEFEMNFAVIAFGLAIVSIHCFWAIFYGDPRKSKLFWIVPFLLHQFWNTANLIVRS